MMARAREYYLGIDLGTTNSVVARGEIDANTNQVGSKIIPVLMAGDPFPKELVPSVVMYMKGQQHPVIGIQAKQKLRDLDPDATVVRSVKLQMGKKNVEGVEELTPEQVSADILKILKGAADKYLHSPQHNVVIGVPACFDSDMCGATMRAAEMAGFTNAQLLTEPKAALLDFMKGQEGLVPASQAIDFNEPRIIVVFDFGGGTLDVTVAKVYQVYREGRGRNVAEIHHEELGVVRYTRLGGDNFDALLATFLERKFYEQTQVSIDSLPDIQKLYVWSKLLEFAEAAKQSLTQEVNGLMDFGGLSEEEAMNRAAIDVHIPFLVGSHLLNYRLTYREHIDIIAPMLGISLQMSDINSPAVQQQVEYQEECQNIVLLIFDALLKAKGKLGDLPSIDAVLINGGMGQLHIIKKRLRDFFNLEHVIEVPFPHLSVAKGAVIHHYNVVHGLDHAYNVLSEAICLKTSGGKGYEVLVKAGEKYPTDDAIVITTMSFFNLPAMIFFAILVNEFIIVHR